MSEYTPTTEEVREGYSRNFSDPNWADDAFDRWLAKRDAEVAAKAWDEGYWQGINGHTGPGNPYRDNDDIVNRKAVQP